jgi:hypothetical protein
MVSALSALITASISRKPSTNACNAAGSPKLRPDRPAASVALSLAPNWNVAKASAKLAAPPQEASGPFLLPPTARAPDRVRPRAARYSLTWAMVALAWSNWALPLSL